MNTLMEMPAYTEETISGSQPAHKPHENATSPVIGETNHPPVTPQVDNRQVASANLFKQSWDECYTQFKAFKDKNGMFCTRPKDIAGRFLLHWIQMQRHLRRSGHLSEEQIRRLDDLGFDWGRVKQASGEIGSKLQESKWQRSFDELVAYKQRFGHCDVPLNFPENVRLGRWVGSQRVAHRNGKLTESRHQRLNDLGFVWQKSLGRPRLQVTPALSPPTPPERANTPEPAAIPEPAQQPIPESY